MKTIALLMLLAQADPRMEACMNQAVTTFTQTDGHALQALCIQTLRANDLDKLVTQLSGAECPKCPPPGPEPMTLDRLWRPVTAGVIGAIFLGVVLGIAAK